MRFSQADSTSSHAGTPWCCQPEKKSHDIVILSFCNIVKGQPKGAYTNHVDSHGGRGVHEMSTLLIKPI